jgi:exodeoxyribonuclease VII large subunit
MLSPDAAQWLIRLRALQQRLRHAIERRQRLARGQYEALQRRLRHPGQRLGQIAQRLDELERRLATTRRHHLQQRQSRLAQLRSRLQRHAPQAQLQGLQSRHHSLQQRLQRAMQAHLQTSRNRLGLAARTLETVSPLATLHRGYAIVTRESDGALIESPRQVAVGEQVRTRLSEGELLCRIEERFDAETLP